MRSALITLNDQQMAEMLCTLIGRMLKIVWHYGPMEGVDESGNWFGHLNHGVSLRTLQLLERLDSEIGFLASRLSLCIEHWSQEKVESNERLLSFTRLRLSDWIIKGRCVETNRIYPTPDWEPRMRLLQVNASSLFHLRVAVDEASAESDEQKVAPCEQAVVDVQGCIGEGDAPTAISPLAEGWDYHDGIFSLNGDFFTLTGMPRKILAELIDSRNHRVLRSQLRGLWKENAVDNHTIHQHVCNLKKQLRKKLPQHAQLDLIQNQSDGDAFAYTLAKLQSNPDQEV